jgi:hypothetical protein
MAQASKGRSITIPRTLNHSTGKESMRQTGFSDAAWGNATRGYATFARSLSKIKFDVIIQEAREFVKPIRRGNRITDTTDIGINIDDERACLVDNSDSASSSGASAASDFCTSFSFLFSTQ